VLVAPEHAAMTDVFEAVLIDHDRDEIRVDLQRRDKGVRELFYDPAFLFRGPAFANFEYNDGHGSSLKYDMGTDDIYSLPRPIRLHNAGGIPFLRTLIFHYCAPIAA
jgi:hypothetical protein